jgi:hypothetical protein
MSCTSILIPLFFNTIFSRHNFLFILKQTIDSKNSIEKANFKDEKILELENKLKATEKKLENAEKKIDEL